MIPVLLVTVAVGAFLAAHRLLQAFRPRQVRVLRPVDRQLAAAERDLWWAAEEHGAPKGPRP